jgi:hypothetical protein
MPKILIRAETNKEPEEFPWDWASRKRFNLDKADVAELKDGFIVWQGNTAYKLADSEEG